MYLARYAPQKEQSPLYFIAMRPNHYIAGTFLQPFSATREAQGTMSFLKLAHKSLAAPVGNPVTQLYRSVNK